MTNKRPSIKGKGADLFLEKPEKPKPAKPTKPAIKRIKQSKATVYLPQTLINRLDNIWLDLRRIHRKLRKSDIVRIALDELFKDYRIKQQDSKLSKHLNG